MKKIFVPTLAFVLSTSYAQAQSSSTPTESDDAKASHASGGPGGTVGAMETYVYGLATSPEDVSRQQNGLNTAAEGGGLLTGRSAIRSGYASGTVGSAPGDTQGR